MIGVIPLQARPLLSWCKQFWFCFMDRADGKVPKSAHNLDFLFSWITWFGIIDTPISTLLTLKEIYNNSVTIVGPSEIWFDFIMWGNNCRQPLFVWDQKGSRPRHNLETGCQYQWVMLQQIMQRSIFVLMAVNLSIHSFAHNGYYSQCDRPIILYKTAVSGVACALQTTQDTQCPNRSLTNARILAWIIWSPS